MCICLYQQVVMSCPGFTSTPLQTALMQNLWFTRGHSLSACFMRDCSSSMRGNDLLSCGVKLVIKSAPLQEAVMKLHYVVEVELSTLRGALWDDGIHRWAQRGKNLVQISIKLALIFPPMTVSDTESICAVIKAAPSRDGFHYQARWFIYLDSDCILQVGLSLFFFLF